MQIKRTAVAQWQGTGKEGNGSLTSQSTVLNKSQYSYGTRFEDGIGTNPEELIAAAHAGCFSMKLAFNLHAAGITPDNIETSCAIILEEGSITESNLETKVKAQGLTNEKLQELVKDAEINCPISKLLTAKISVVATLI